MSVIDLIYANITKLEKSKEAIRQAIIQMGVDVGIDIPFSLYPEFIRAIELNEVLFAVIDSINNYNDRTYKWVYATDTKSWYTINDCGDYSEWGEYIVGEEPTCKFNGLLWVQNDGVEYEWNGNNWEIIGECPEAACCQPIVFYDGDTYDFRNVTSITPCEFDFSNLTSLTDSTSISLAKQPNLEYIEIDVTNCTNLYHAFVCNQGDKYYECHVNNSQNVVNFEGAFAMQNNFTILGDLHMESAQNTSWMCSDNGQMTTVGKIYVSDKTSSGVFSSADSTWYRCNAITNFGGWIGATKDISITSWNLTHASLMNIINGLATVNVVKNINLGSINFAKLSDEDIAIATNKGWNVY